MQNLKEFGFNFVMIPIYKRFGLETERATMEEVKRFTEVCHRLGVRVGVYAFSGTIGCESVVAENPGAREWLVWDREGKSIPYGAQYYRRWVNRSHPEVRAHLKEVVRYAVQEAMVDLIHLDNYHVAPGHCQCRHKTPAVLPVLSLGSPLEGSGGHTNAAARDVGRTWARLGIAR